MDEALRAARVDPAPTIPPPVREEAPWEGCSSVSVPFGAARLRMWFNRADWWLDVVRDKGGSYSAATIAQGTDDSEKAAFAAALAALRKILRAALEEVQ